MSSGIDTELSKSTYLSKSEIVLLHILAQNGIRQSRPTRISRITDELGDKGWVYVHMHNTCFVFPSERQYFSSLTDCAESVQSCQTFASTVVMLLHSSSLRPLKEGIAYPLNTAILIDREKKGNTWISVYRFNTKQVSSLTRNLSNLFSSQST